jgi:aminopeptidase N
VEHIASLDNPLARALCWAASWDMVRDAELAARDYVKLVTTGIPAEKDINLVTATLRQAQSALSFYADPAWAPEGWQQLAATAAEALRNTAPGSGFQLAWARAYASSARTDADRAVIAGWLRGENVPEGLSIAADLRWGILQSLVAGGVIGAEVIEEELNNDRTASGERQAAFARALLPTAESKAETWRRLVEDHQLPNWLQRALLMGFQHSSQVELTAPYVAAYFESLLPVWEHRDSEPAQEFVEMGYPLFQVSEDTVARTDAWLAQANLPAPLRRLVAEGKDGVVRALKARAKDSL